MWGERYDCPVFVDRVYFTPHRVVLQLGLVIEEIFPADNEIIMRRIPIGG